MAPGDPSDLYGLPLDRFVAERGALAKALRGAGDNEEAARVSALRKPSVAAWTVNQLVRTQRPAVAALFSAGDGLQRAQAELLAGRGDAGAMREAARSERGTVDELAEVARGLLSSEGQGPTQATLDRVSETLHAAALNEEARAQVQAGCLERELRPVGFGGGGAGVAPARPPGGRGRAERTERTEREVGEGGRGARDHAAREEAKRERAAHERADRDRAERLKAARTAEAGARRLAEQTARGLHTAQERRERAASSLRDAEDALAAARERSEEAALARRRAQQALDDV